MSRRENFHESSGNPIKGYSTDSGTVCKNCAKNDPEWADVNPKETTPIYQSDFSGKYPSYPEGSSCQSCGDEIGGPSVRSRWN